MECEEVKPVSDGGGGGETDRRRKFQVDMDLIQATQLTDDTDDLRGLDIDVFNQEDFEQGVMKQVDEAITKEEEKRKKEALKKDLKTVNDNIRSLKHELASLATQLAQLGQGKSFSTGGANRRLTSAKKQKETKLLEMKSLEEKKKNIQARLDGKAPLFDEKEMALKSVLASSGNEAKDSLIKTGEMTPFGTVVNQQHVQTQEHIQVKAEPIDDQETQVDTGVGRRAHIKKEHELSDSEPSNHSDGEEWLPSNHQEDLIDSDIEEEAIVKREDSSLRADKEKKRRKKNKGWSKVHNRPIYRSHSEDSDSDREERLPRAKAIRKYRDDGHEDYYDERMEKFNDNELFKQKAREAGRMSDSEEDEEFDGGMKVPGRIWSKLYKYQKTCVKWLWELHCQQAGGIVGDEMGLGKTIQAIAFLAGLKYSRIRNRNFSYVGLGPSIIVCPATVMHQWVKEFHTWWPPCRVAILHGSGTFIGKDKDLIRHVVKNNGILVTSYSTLVLQQENLLLYDWHYIILDEGHKIRNPDVKATLVCKQFRTPHRIILSGSPIQNNLKELWSLMDFVFPGKLGTLPDFMQHFAVPIVQGGYSNATDVQVQTAYKCACVLRDTINPYLLRRMKADVKMNINLPSKNEQVLFCRLSADQREVYEEYLASRECQEILRGRLMVFAGLIQLRKLCNHPDLATGGPRVFKGDNTGNDPSMDYGYWKRAGKMIVVDALLKLWKKQGHKALIFTQSTQMLDIIEKYVQEKRYTYVRMDGCTGISSRQPLVQKYNSDDQIYLFLLTTRVGGLGVNLVGANRIIIYDPDWNPSTDMQARERAWRIGQKRQVTIYRLLTTGTIEEKIYHRQIFKQFLTNRVLKDPKQRRLFKTNDLNELFSLGLSDDKGETETAAIFAGTGSDVTVKKPGNTKNRFDKIKEEKKRLEKEKEEEEKLDDIAMETNADLNFDRDEIARMREMAKKMSQKMEQDKLSKFMKRSSSNSDSGSDSKDKSGEVKNTGRDSGRDTSKEKTNKEGDNEGPDRSTNSQESSLSARDKLNKYKIKKKPSSQDLNVDSGLTRDTPTPVKGSITNSSSSEQHKRKYERDKINDTKERIMGEPSEKRCKEEREHSKSKHKKKKHRRKDAKFEGERISHLDKLRTYKAPVEPQNSQSDHNEMDNYVLKKLFQKTGIQGALHHDKVMDPGQSDYVIVESEADKIAKEASLALKKSRSQCLPATAGVPTWTGQHGIKRPRFGQKKNTILQTALEKPSTSKPVKNEENEVDEVPRDQHFDGSLAGSVHTNLKTGASVQGVVSSTDLLNKMRVRNEVCTNTANIDDEDANDDEDVHVSDPNSLDLLKKMREFILFECKKFGQATTKELLDEFGPKLPSENSAKFRALLNSICNKETEDGTIVWKLRSDFR